MRIPLAPPQLNFSESGVVDAVLRVVAAGATPAPGGRYLHWDEFRHRSPPQGISVENFWHAVKYARRAASRPLPLRDLKGSFVRFANVPLLTEFLHMVDRDAAGAIRSPGQVPLTDSGTRDRYLIASLFEESITSSQLEGASTSRANAKQMLREGRAPRDHGERMILNNYAAMEWLRSKHNEPLTPAFVFELHALVTDGTLDDPESGDRFRRDGDEIVVSDETGRILHRPPREAELAGRLDDLCTFANANESGEDFLHPVLRSILIHFQFAYDHPFVDGNGRVARALFYWSMARHGYWLCEFVSISRILKKARAQYLRSFLFTESDENDTTYFLLDQLRVLRRAIEDLHHYLMRKAQEERDAETILRRTWKTDLVLNERQLALLARALRAPDTVFTVETHRRSHGIAYDTARTDLAALTDDGLLTMRKRGRRFLFAPSKDLSARASAL
jgi:Fic family protein